MNRPKRKRDRVARGVSLVDIRRCNLCHYWWQYVCMMCCTPSTPSSVIFHSPQCYLTGGRVTKTIISSGLYQRPLLTFLSVKTSSWTWDQLWKFLDLNLPVVPSYKPFQQEQVGGRLCKTWRTDWTESTYAEYRCNSPSPASLALPSFCGVETKLPPTTGPSSQVEFICCSTRSDSVRC